MTISLLLIFLSFYTVSADNREVSKVYGDYEIVVKEVITNKDRTEVHVEFIGPSQNYPNDESYAFQVWDDSGNMLIPTSADVLGVQHQQKNDSMLYEAVLKFERHPLETEFLKVVPTIEKIDHDPNSKSSGKIVTTETIKESEKIKKPLAQFPFTLSQGEIGDIEIQKIDYLQDKTILYIDPLGMDDFNQVTNLWIEDNSGNTFESENLEFDYDNNVYKLEFPRMNNSQNNLNIVTTNFEAPNVFNELEIKVPLTD